MQSLKSKNYRKDEGDKFSMDFDFNDDGHISTGEALFCSDIHY